MKNEEEEEEDNEDGMKLCMNCGREKFMHRIVEFYDLNNCSGFQENKTPDELEME